MLYDEVMLIRCPPDARHLQPILSALSPSADRRRLVFFHGPGLAWAQGQSAGQMMGLAGTQTTLMLCSAGWRRRQSAPPPEGWQLGSLVRFWDAADRAERVLTFGASTE